MTLKIRNDLFLTFNSDLEIYGRFICVLPCLMTTELSLNNSQKISESTLVHMYFYFVVMLRKQNFYRAAEFYFSTSINHFGEFSSLTLANSNALEKKYCQIGLLLGFVASLEKISTYECISLSLDAYTFIRIPTWLKDGQIPEFNSTYWKILLNGTFICICTYAFLAAAAMQSVPKQ